MTHVKSPVFVTTKEAQAMLGLGTPDGTVERLRKGNVIPFRTGRIYQWPYEDVARLAAPGSPTPCTQPETSVPDVGSTEAAGLTPCEQLVRDAMLHQLNAYGQPPDMGKFLDFWLSHMQRANDRRDTARPVTV